MYEIPIRMNLLRYFIRKGVFSWNHYQLFSCTGQLISESQKSAIINNAQSWPNQGYFSIKLISNESPIQMILEVDENQQKFIQMLDWRWIWFKTRLFQRRQVLLFDFYWKNKLADHEILKGIDWFNQILEKAHISFDFVNENHWSIVYLSAQKTIIALWY